MRAIQIGVLGAGLAFAGLGVYMAQTYVSETQAALMAAQSQGGGSAIALTEVLVAARPLRYGEPVAEADVRVVPWPADAVPPGVFRTIEELMPDANRPRVALRAMEPNEPLMQIKFSEPGAEAGIATMLTPGFRAFTIRVDQNSGISGTLRPSNLVDIYWTGRGGDDGEITRLLSSSVRIIALDEDPDQDRTFSGVPRSMTVEAEPETIAILAQGQSTGRLSLSLVGLDDETALSQFQVDNRTMLGIEAPVQQQAAQVCSVRTRRGADVVLIEIPCNN